MRFLAGTSDIPRSRHWVTQQARTDGASTEALRVLALLTTEAVTNAVEHGPADGEIDVDVERHGRSVRVLVRDGNQRPPVLTRVPPSAAGGRGVMLIDMLAASWGVDYHPDGTKTVWFDVPLGAGGEATSESGPRPRAPER